MTKHVNGMCFLFLCVVMGMGCSEVSEHIRIEASEFREGDFIKVPKKWWVPKQATDIVYEYDNPFLGGSARAKCKIAKKDLLSTAKEKGWHLRSDTTRYNSRTGQEGDIDYSEPVVRHFEGVKRPIDYLSYNYVNSNGGGVVVLYDVDCEVLYLNWSSN